MESSAWVELRNLVDRFDWKSLYGNSQPVELDLGAGDGSFAAAMAKAHPHVNLLAVERLLGRARKIVRKSDRDSLSNLKVLRLESLYTVEYLVPPSSLHGIHLLFPDPWPKRRHWKNRIVQPHFMAQSVKALAPGGVFHFATDHQEYFAAASSVIDNTPGLKPLPQSPWPEIPSTDFESEYLREGRPIGRRFWVKA